MCSDGTSTCRKFSDDENTLAELAYLLLEVARFEDAQTFLKTWANLIRENPVLAEDVIVAIGQTIEALDGSGIDVEDDNLYIIAEKLLPMLDEVFESPTVDKTQLPEPFSIQSMTSVRSHVTSLASSSLP